MEGEVTKAARVRKWSEMKKEVRNTFFLPLMEDNEKE